MILSGVSTGSSTTQTRIISSPFTFSFIGTSPLTSHFAMGGYYVGASAGTNYTPYFSWSTATNAVAQITTAFVNNVAFSYVDYVSTSEFINIFTPSLSLSTFDNTLTDTSPISDSFTRADNASSLGNTDTGQTWTQVLRYMGIYLETRHMFLAEGVQLGAQIITT